MCVWAQVVQAPRTWKRGADPDRVLVNTRPPRPEDGLLEDDALEALFGLSDEPTPHSAYDDGQRARAAAGATDVDTLRCGERLGIEQNALGAYEPVYTNYTFYWKLTLGEHVDNQALGSSS